MTVERMVELLEIEKECVLRNATGECNRYCAGCDLLQDDSELHEMYTEAIALLKAQEPRVMAGAELTDAELIEEIRKAPLVLKQNVDAVPVVRGRWIDENPDDYLDPRMRCSICTGVESPLLKWRYCPNCGARMDGERRDEDV